MAVRGLIPVISLQLSSDEQIREIAKEAHELNAAGTWVQLNLQPAVVTELGLGDILDPILDIGIEIASIRVKEGEFTEDLVEKLAMMADETGGRAIIVRASRSVIESLEQWHQVFSTYKVKLLLEPTTPREARKIYNRFEDLIGGVIGFSQIQDYYTSTEDFLRVLTSFLQVTRNVQLSNYRGDEPAGILSVGIYNNPLLLRVLVQRDYQGFVTLSYEKCSSRIALDFLLRELRAVSSFLMSLHEKA